MLVSTQFQAACAPLVMGFGLTGLVIVLDTLMASKEPS
eukprot:SAG31_NODE_29450_length_395_cov_0.820946_1_plen_37_part_10